MSQEFDNIVTPEMTKMVDEAAEKIGEHFDSVIIFVTLNAGGTRGTGSYCTGKGNWFARYGQVREWLNREDEKGRIDTRNDEKKDDE